MNCWEECISASVTGRGKRMESQVVAWRDGWLKLRLGLSAYEKLEHLPYQQRLMVFIQDRELVGFLSALKAGLQMPLLFWVSLNLTHIY